MGCHAASASASASDHHHHCRHPYCDRRRRRRRCGSSRTTNYWESRRRRQQQQQQQQQRGWRGKRHAKLRTTMLSCIAFLLSSLCSGSSSRVVAASMIKSDNNKVHHHLQEHRHQIIVHSQHQHQHQQQPQPEESEPPLLHLRHDRQHHDRHHHHHHHHHRRKLNVLLPEAPPISPFRVGRIKSSSDATSTTSSTTTNHATIDNTNEIIITNSNTNTLISSASSGRTTGIQHDDALEASSSDHLHHQLQPSSFQQTTQQQPPQQQQQLPQQQQPYHPISEYDRDPQIQYYGSSQFSNTFNNADNNHNRNNNNNNVNDNDDNNNNNSNVSAWAPEDYPDPWTNPTLCSGAAAAAAAAAVSSSLSSDEGVGGKRRALFCDPDQVLDRETLLSVASKLREFANSFALSTMDITEGVEFGDVGVSGSVSGGGGSGGSDSQQPSQENDALNHSRILADSDAVGGIFSTTTTTTESEMMQSSTKELDGTDGTGEEEQKIEIAIALVKKIDLPAILRADSYFYYSDQDDMVNDAAQYFARYIHDNWSRYLAREQNSSSVNIVLIFISTLDRICYISSGNRLAAVLPWWRLEHVVQDMKQDLQKRQIGDAILIAIDDLTSLLIGGPPSFRDRVNDFFQRFGIVILFTIFTFTFATLGECRETRRRIFFADRRSRMNSTERENARLLQKVFRTKSCPICLEPFEPDIATIDMEQSLEKHKQRHTRIDSYGIPLIGTDDKPIKLLRCGHIFDMTCWQMWVDSGQGNVLICPVCRQDVGAPKRESTSHSRGSAARQGAGAVRADGFVRAAEEGRHPSEQSSLFARIMANTSGPSMLLRPVNNTRQNYNAIPTQSDPLPARVLIDRQRSAPTIMQLSMHSMNGESTATTSEIDELSNEQTPFLSQVTRGNRVGNYY